MITAAVSSVAMLRTCMVAFAVSVGKRKGARSMPVMIAGMPVWEGTMVKNVEVEEEEDMVTVDTQRRGSNLGSTTR